MKLSKNNAFRPVALCAILAATNSLQAGAIPLQNGDFANPTINGTFTTLFATDSTDIPGWTVSSGSVDFIGNYWQTPPAGGQSVDLDGDSPGSLQQSVTIPAAGTVAVDFDLAGNPDYGSTKYLLVDLIPTSGPALAPDNFTFDSSGHSRSDMGWQAESALFNVSAPGTYELEFASADASWSPYGPVLGDVSMSENVANVQDNGPTLLLLAGGCGALALLRRKLAVASV